MVRWIQQDCILGLERSNGDVYFPSAREIYSVVFSCSDTSATVDGEVIAESPRIAFHELHFSKFGARITLCLKFDAEAGQISCLAEIRRGARLIDVTLQVQAGIDHVIDNSSWYFFSENFEQTKDLLKSAEVTDLSGLKFSSYLKIVNSGDKFPAVEVLDEAGQAIHKIHTSAGAPQKLEAKLYPYQSVGFEWLRFITDAGCGGILGDEMGLGKTLQVIALILFRRGAATSPALVVAPVSLLENWRREIFRFAPSMRVWVNHGPKRTGNFKDLLGFDVVVISYNSAVSDSSMLAMIQWDLVVLDEAQNIKNPFASRTVSVKQIPRKAGVAVSGTPFQNHITDIWSVVDFALPGHLGSLREFENKYSDDIVGAEDVEPKLTPIMLRRMVKDVAKDLPERVVVTQPLQMTDDEARRYETARQDILRSATSGRQKLVELTKLRMYCTHPQLSGYGRKDPLAGCTKYSRLCEVLEEIVAKGEKCILFTSFVKMAEILMADIHARFGIPVMMINGSTPAEQRQGIVDSYGELPGAALLVLNPQAAGTGLNITSANHVIHYNLEWNPALEDQASARAFRRGQERTVFIYRFFYEGTVEEFVNGKIEDKREVSGIAVVGNSGDECSADDFIKALSLSPMGTN